MRRTGGSIRSMRLALTLAVLALLAAPPANAADPLLLYPALGRPSLVTVVGQAPRPAPKAAMALVEVSLSGLVRRVPAGPDGRFEATFAAPADRPFPVGTLQARAAAGLATASGDVVVVDDGAPFLLVLDLDDLPGLLRKPAAPGEEEAPPGAMAVLLRCMLTATRPAAAAVAVTGRPPSEVAVLRDALAREGFPPVAIRPQPGPGGPEAALRALLSGFPQAVVLLGDGTGRAPARFAALAAEFPARVVATYLRASATGAGDRRFEGAVLFTDPLELANRAAARGVADAACAARAAEAAAAASPSSAPPGATLPNGMCQCPCPVPAEPGAAATAPSAAPASPAAARPPGPETKKPPAP